MNSTPCCPIRTRASKALLALAAASLLTVGASAQAPKGPGKGFGKGLGKNGGEWLEKKDRRNNGSPQETEKMTPAPSDRFGVIELGQSLRGEIGPAGSRLFVKFRAVKGAKVRLTMLAARGDPGDSDVTLLGPNGIALIEFKAEGRRYTLDDYELPTTGAYTVRFMNRGEDYVDLALASGGTLPTRQEHRLDLTTREAKHFEVEGMKDRMIDAVLVEPVDTKATLGVRVTVTDRQDEKIASFESMDLSAARPKIDPGDPIALDDNGTYRVDLWLTSGESPQAAKVKVIFKNPKLATGTVRLEDLAKPEK